VTFDSLQAQQTQAKNLVEAWAAGIRKLGKTFGKTATGRQMLEQLASGGPSDYPEVKALLSATPKDLANFVSTERQINATSGGLGNYVGNTLYGSQISGLQKEIRVDNASIKALGREIAHQVHEAVKDDERRPIEIKIGSQVIARVTAEGNEEEPEAVVSAISLPYLGKPGAMRVLPSPNGPVAATPDKSDVVKELLSGGVAVLTRFTRGAPTRCRTSSSTPPAPICCWGSTTGCSVTARSCTSTRRCATSSASTCRRAGCGPTPHRTGSPPRARSRRPRRAARRGSRPACWRGRRSPTAPPCSRALSRTRRSITKAPVYLPTEAVTVSVYAKASASHTATLQLTGYDAAGAPNYTSSTASMALTTSWQRFTVTVAAGLGGLASSAFVLPGSCSAPPRRRRSASPVRRSSTAPRHGVPARVRVAAGAAHRHPGP
jgi:hypothetical protein